MRIRLSLALLLFACLAPSARPVAAEDAKPIWPWKYPPGISTQTIGRLNVTLLVPRKLTPHSKSSLLVLLHGARARASNLATLFHYWPSLNYVVVAPQATGPVWSATDLAKVRGIVGLLRRSLPLHGDRLHVAGFSNGASNLASVAFAEDMKARSGTWVGGGFAGGPIPGWAKQRFGALFMAGENDFALTRVRQSPARMQGRVRSVEFHVEPDIAHTWPTPMIEYNAWWMGVQEGRFQVGEDCNFEYGDSLSEALQAVKQGQARGAFVYVYDPVTGAADSASGRHLQHVTLMDPLVRRRGRRLLAVRMTRKAFAAQHPTWKIPGTPAVLVFDRQGQLTATLSGQIDAPALRDALLPVAGQ